MVADDRQSELFVESGAGIEVGARQDRGDAVGRGVGHAGSLCPPLRWRQRQLTRCAAASVSAPAEVDKRSAISGLAAAIQPSCADRPSASRSEEHTSELQSLMSISNDVFCWQKKKISIKQT